VRAKLVVPARGFRYNRGKEFFWEKIIMSSVIAADPGAVESVIGDCAAALRRMAQYRLPAALDQRLLWLSENKDSLTDVERQELLALVDLADEKTVERLQAQVTLQRIGQAFPRLGRPSV
jgi:hypothetical protein